MTLTELVLKMSPADRRQWFLRRVATLPLAERTAETIECLYDLYHPAGQA